MTERAIQEHYPEDLSHCYGCGIHNEHGLHLKSYWDGEEVVATFQPREYHTGIPGYVYGGLIASLIDCHSTATASIAATLDEGRELGSDPVYRFVTASLQVSYDKPTPLGPPLEIRGRVSEVKGRKVVVQTTISADGEVCVRGDVVAVRMPEDIRPQGQKE